MTGLTGRVALVTGGNRGIGAAISKKLGRAGATVIISFLQHDDSAAVIAGEVEAAGGKAVLLKADLSDSTALSEAWTRAQAEGGLETPSILVHGAGSPLQPSPFLDASWDAFARHWAVAVGGAFNVSRLCLPGMVARKRGSIVFLSSAAAHGTPPPQWSGYVTAKSGLLGLMRSLAIEFGPHGVRVNAVSPGMVPTDFTAFVPDRMKQMAAMQTPLKRLATVEDVAATVAFLVSDEAAFVTGAIVPVAGGAVMP